MGGADEMTVSTLLVQDPAHLRATLLHRMGQQSTQLCATTDDPRRGGLYRGGITKDDEQKIREAMDDLNTCLELRGQIGWRD